MWQADRVEEDQRARGGHHIHVVQLWELRKPRRRARCEARVEAGGRDLLKAGRVLGTEEAAKVDGLPRHLEVGRAQGLAPAIAEQAAAEQAAASEHAAAAAAAAAAPFDGAAVEAREAKLAAGVKVLEEDGARAVEPAYLMEEAIRVEPAYLMEEAIRVEPAYLMEEAIRVEPTCKLPLSAPTGSALSSARGNVRSAPPSASFHSSLR